MSDLRILALGDSLTYGYLVPVGYLPVLTGRLQTARPHLRVENFNHGVCGECAHEGLRRLPALLARLRPTAVLLQFGLNDCFSAVPLRRFERALEELVETTRKANAAPVLVPPPPLREAAFEEEFRPYRALFAELAARLAVPVVPTADFWRARSPDEALWLADGVHPSEAGYRRLAEAIACTLLAEI